MVHETEIMEALEERLGEGYKVELKPISKTNNQTRAGVVIKKEGARKNISPVLYLEDIMDSIKTGEMSFSEAVDMIIEEYGKAEETKRIRADIDNMGKEEFLQRIIPQAVSREKNMELLSRAPHKELLDLAIIYRCDLGLQGGRMANFMVTDHILERWDATLEELESAAKQNALREDVYQIQTIDSVLIEAIRHTGMEKADVLSGEAPCEMYVITDKRKVFGAAVLDFPEVFEKLAREISGNLLILPSSIHEVIAVPETGGEDIGLFRQMVSEINCTQLEPEEVLSNQIYRYDMNTGMIEIA